jgi:hypothetical protein
MSIASSGVRNLPTYQCRLPGLAINLKAAKALGLKID